MCNARRFLSSCTFIIITTFTLSLFLNSCLYRSPNEDEFDTNPTTNNPHINKNRAKDDFIPGVQY